MDEALAQVTVLLESLASDSFSSSSLDSARTQLGELQTRLRKTREEAARGAHTLRSAGAGLLTKYYWLVFVLMYAGVYLWQ